MNSIKQSVSPQMGFLRAPPLSAIPELLSELGIDPAPLLKSCGIEDEKIFLDPEALLSFTVAGKLFKACAETTGLPHFSLLVGQRAQPDCLGAVGLLLLNSPDVISALNELVANLDIHEHGSTTFLETTGEQAVLGYEVYVSGVKDVELIYDCAIAIGWNIMRNLCGTEWLPTEVCLRHAKPADIEPYQRFFQAPLRFNSSQSCLVFSKRWLSQSLQLANPALRQHIHQKIEEVRSNSTLSFREQAHKTLVMLLGFQRGTREDLAESFGMHTRTLNRRLKDNGTNFRELQASASHEMARQLLRDTKRSIPAIASMLGFSDATAFSRSFSKWEGVSPAKWRKFVSNVSE